MGLNFTEFFEVHGFKPSPWAKEHKFPQGRLSAHLQYEKDPSKGRALGFVLAARAVIASKGAISFPRLRPDDFSIIKELLPFLIDGGAPPNAGD